MSEGRTPVVDSADTIEDKENSPGLLSPKGHSRSLQLLHSLRKDLKTIGRHNRPPAKQLPTPVSSSTKKTKIKIGRRNSTMAMTTRRKHQNLMKTQLEDVSAPNMKTVPRRRTTAAVVAVLKSNKVSGVSTVPSSNKSPTSNNLSFANLEKLSQRMQSHVTASKEKLILPTDPGQQDPPVLRQPPPLLPSGATATATAPPTQQDPAPCTFIAQASTHPPVRTKVKFDNLSQLLSSFNRLVPGSNLANNTAKSCEAAPPILETDKCCNSVTIDEIATTAENERRLCFLTEDEEIREDIHEDILADLPIEESIDVGEAFPCDELEPSRMIPSPLPIEPVSTQDPVPSQYQESVSDEICNHTAFGNSESFNNGREEDSGRPPEVEEAIGGEKLDTGMTIHSPRSVQIPFSQAEHVSYVQEDEMNHDQSLFSTEEGTDASETMSEEFSLSVNLEIDSVVSQFIRSPFSLEQDIILDLIQDGEEEMEFANLNTGSVHTVETVTNDKDPLSESEHLRRDVAQPQPTPTSGDNGDADIVLLGVVKRKQPIQPPQESSFPSKKIKLTIVDQEVAKGRAHADAGADQNPTLKSKLSKPVVSPVRGGSNNGKRVPKPKGPDSKTLNRTDNLGKSVPSPRSAPVIDLNNIIIVTNSNSRTAVIPKTRSGPPKPIRQSQSSHLPNQQAGRTMPPRQGIPPGSVKTSSQVLPSGQILPPGWTIERTQNLQLEQPTHQPVNQGRKIMHANRRLIPQNIDPLAQVKIPPAGPHQNQNSAHNRKVQNSAQLQKVQNSVQRQKVQIQKSHQLQNVQKSAQLQKLHNSVQLQNTQNSVQLQKVQLQKVQLQKVELQKVQLQKVQLQKVQLQKGQFQQIQNRNQLGKIQNLCQVQKVGKPSEDSDDDVKIISIHRRKDFSSSKVGGLELPFKESSLSPLPFQINPNCSYRGPASGPPKKKVSGSPTKKNSVPPSSSAGSRLEDNLHDAILRKNQPFPLHPVLLLSKSLSPDVAAEERPVREREAAVEPSSTLTQGDDPIPIDIELLSESSLRELGLTPFEIDVPITCLSLPLDRTDSLCENCGYLFDESVTEHTCKWLCDLCGQFFYGGKSIFVDHRLLCDGKDPRDQVREDTNAFLNYHDLQIMVISAEDEKLIGEAGEKMNTTDPTILDGDKANGIVTPRQIPTLVKLKSPTSDEDKTPTFVPEQVKTPVRSRGKVSTKSKKKRKEKDDFTDTDSDEEYMDESDWRSSSESPSKRPARKRKPPRRYLEETSIAASIDKLKIEATTPTANSIQSNKSTPKSSESESSITSSSSEDDDELSDFANEHSENISGDEDPGVSRKGIGRKRSSRAFAELNGIIKTYRCEVCNKKLRSEIAMANHLFTHASQASFDCDRCTLCFERPMELHRHVIANHRDVHEPKIRK